MKSALWILLVSLIPLACASGQGYPLDTGFRDLDSRYRWSEEHTSSEVNEGERKGWTEFRDTVQFGAYGLSVTQRIDPQTGLPSQGRTLWGDTFVGITGHKPAVYMASNWSPWTFLAAEIRLSGEDKDLPQPTARGRLTFLGLREIGPSRMVAEAAWTDAAGGILLARCVGWPRTDLFGMALRYLPPPGRTVDSLAFVLTCQPYDYSDRGLWERQRWFASPVRAVPLTSPAPVPFELPGEWRFVLHNRHAQTDSGCLLALDSASVGNAEIRLEGVTLKLRITPAASDRDCLLLLGDWVDEEPAAVCGRFLGGEGKDLVALIAEMGSLRPAKPAVADPAADREIDALLAAHPALQDQFAESVARSRADLQEALGALDASGDGDSAASVAAVSRVCNAARVRDETYRAVREAWVSGSLWRAAQ